MKVITWSIVILFCSCLARTVSSATIPQEDDGVRVLQNYQGLWDNEFTIESQSADEKTSGCTGIVEGKWVVDDQFMEQTGNYRIGDSASPIIIKTMMSFDKKMKRYQYDYYLSSGEIQKSFGSWDKESKSMTSTMADNGDGKITTIKADFSSENIERWTIETVDRDGKTALKIVGTNTRRKPQ